MAGLITPPVSAFIRASVLSVSLLLVACSGEDGRQGESGPAGPAIAGVSSEAKSLVVEISQVSIGSPTTVQFKVLNQNQVSYIGLSASTVRFNLSKLVPGTDGSSSHWQNYINRVETANGIGPGTIDTIQATTENNGDFVNHGNGLYTYTFSTDITAVTTPLAVTYDSNLTHRLAMQISGSGVPVANAIYTWRPSDGATQNITQREIVQTSSCNSCHVELALHGGGRIETQYCVTCHNPGSRDANSGNTVDFSVMVHKIHSGEHLPSVATGSEYAIWGFRDTKHDYSDVVYPQDIRNCSKCHNGTDALTPQGDNWMSQPSRESCGACHDDVNFVTGQGHSPSNFSADNSQCTVCHSDDGFVGSVASSHEIPAKLAAARFQFNILNVSDTAPGAFPKVRFSVTDPSNADAAYDLSSAPSWIQVANRASRLAVAIGWNTQDYHNTGSGSTPGLPISINALENPNNNGDGSYTVTSSIAIPASVTGSGVAALEGHPAADYDGDGAWTDRVPVSNALTYFPITDLTAVPRRKVVDMAQCNQCHDNLSLHGNNRTGDAQVCVLCHNANATDSNRRPADAATTADGKAEESIDFKRMIHAIHGAEMRESDFVVYGFGGSEHNFGEVGYPGRLSHCASCHVTDSHKLPLALGVLATTTDTGADKADPVDDLNITATAAVCSSCHDGALTKTHMEQNGASFMTPQSMVDNGSFTETCAICHGPGRIADLDVVHGR